MLTAYMRHENFSKIYFLLLQIFWDEKEDHKFKLDMNEIEEINTVICRLSHMLSEEDVNKNLFMSTFCILMGLFERANIKMSS